MHFTFAFQDLLWVKSLLSLQECVGCVRAFWAAIRDHVVCHLHAERPLFLVCTLVKPIWCQLDGSQHCAVYAGHYFSLSLQL